MNAARSFSRSVASKFRCRLGNRKVLSFSTLKGARALPTAAAPTDVTLVFYTRTPATMEKRTHFHVFDTSPAIIRSLPLFARAGWVRGTGYLPQAAVAHSAAAITA